MPRKKKDNIPEDNSPDKVGSGEKEKRTRCTNLEHAERVDYASKLLLKTRSWSTAIQVLMSKYHVSDSTANRYIKESKQQSLDMLNNPDEITSICIMSIHEAIIHANEKKDIQAIPKLTHAAMDILQKRQKQINNFNNDGKQYRRSPKDLLRDLQLVEKYAKKQQE